MKYNFDFFFILKDHKDIFAWSYKIAMTNGTQVQEKSQLIDIYVKCY